MLCRLHNQDSIELTAVLCRLHNQDSIELTAVLCRLHDQDSIELTALLCPPLAAIAPVERKFYIGFGREHPWEERCCISVWQHFRTICFLIDHAWLSICTQVYSGMRPADLEPWLLVCSFSGALRMLSVLLIACSLPSLADLDFLKNPSGDGLPTRFWVVVPDLSPAALLRLVQPEALARLLALQAYLTWHGLNVNFLDLPGLILQSALAHGLCIPYSHFGQWVRPCSWTPGKRLRFCTQSSAFVSTQRRIHSPFHLR